MEFALLFFGGIPGWNRHSCLFMAADRNVCHTFWVRTPQLHNRCEPRTMKLISNHGRDRVADALDQYLRPGARLDLASPAFSLFAFGALRDALLRVAHARLLLPQVDKLTGPLGGNAGDRAFRNQLQSGWLARQLLTWLDNVAEVRVAPPDAIPQAVILAQSPVPDSAVALTGHCPFTTEGIGITPGTPFAFVQASENAAEVAPFAAWFETLWRTLPADTTGKKAICELLKCLAAPPSPERLYSHVLNNLFTEQEDKLDEATILKTATGIQTSVVWKKLYRFQRDGAVGAIDKLERHGGCILADSVGLGKTFEALAVIKYYELRNDRVLVLCPKRLRDNWTLYKANDRRNILASDRFHYDVLNHTDLSRDDGVSGDIDLAHVNWGNYDLVVIDESHNFRNKAAAKTRETRYGRLMRRIIQAGVKTRVLMLSATPVNNRLNDLKNQIAFITEGDDAAMTGHGLPSIEATIRQAQVQFNRWLKLGETERTAAGLLDMLAFDYFRLLDLLTIARSRRHIERYYGTDETGRFPERMTPLNLKPDVDRAGAFPSIREINREIRKLHLAAYAPLRYVLPHKQDEYNRKYSVKVGGGEGFFRQKDREESLIHLMRVNLLKRMESAVGSFGLTVGRQLADLDTVLSKLNSNAVTVEELSITDLDVDDATFEALLVGTKIKVLFRDVDTVRWRQDLTEDHDRLASLLNAARDIGADRDAKLAALREVIVRKVRQPLNPENRKVLIFSAFTDTADYLYRELAPWAQAELGLHSGIVTGSGHNQSTLPGIRNDMSGILAAFAPRAKERAPEFAADGEIDLLIATDCISEGQNLQDCDFLVNYDIHWNPVRIIQRFGRIDRLGSANTRIQLVNFWPNLELEEYINLERRVSGRMVLLDISATGEENLIEQEAGDPMNDLEYRRKQLLKLQEGAVDFEDVAGGVAITDLTLTDFRLDLARLAASAANTAAAPTLPLIVPVTTAPDIPAGVIFCLRAATAKTQAALVAAAPGYPLAPHYLIHVDDQGAVLLPHTHARPLLDRLRRLCVGRDATGTAAAARFDRATRGGEDMTRLQRLLAKAVAGVLGKQEERAAASLFAPGGTHALHGEFAGMDDFEVVACLVALAAENAP